MHYKLYYSGTEGNLSAYVTYDGRTISTTSGLKDKKAAHKWAHKVSRDHKVENTPEATESHSVSVSGSKAFSL